MKQRYYLALVLLITGCSIPGYEPSGLHGYRWKRDGYRASKDLIAPDGKIVATIYGISECNGWIKSPFLEFGTYDGSCWSKSGDLLKREIEIAISQGTDNAK